MGATKIACKQTLLGRRSFCGVKVVKDASGDAASQGPLIALGAKRLSLLRDIEEGCLEQDGGHLRTDEHLERRSPHTAIVEMRQDRATTAEGGALKRFGKSERGAHPRATIEARKKKRQLGDFLDRDAVFARGALEEARVVRRIKDERRHATAADLALCIVEMDGDEHIGTGRIRELGALLERNAVVSIPREVDLDLWVHLAEHLSSALGEFKGEMRFAQALARCTVFIAPVARIENDGRRAFEAFFWRASGSSVL